MTDIEMLKFSTEQVRYYLERIDKLRDLADDELQQMLHMIRKTTNVVAQAPLADPPGHRDSLNEELRLLRTRLRETEEAATTLVGAAKDYIDHSQHTATGFMSTLYTAIMAMNATIHLNHQTTGRGEQPHDRDT